METMSNTILKDLITVPTLSLPCQSLTDRGHTLTLSTKKFLRSKTTMSLPCQSITNGGHISTLSFLNKNALSSQGHFFGFNKGTNLVTNTVSADCVQP